MTNIQTISYGVLGEANQIEINLMTFVLGEIPQVQVRITDGQKDFEFKFLTMPNDVYQAWGTNDQTVIDWVLNELELTEA
jgi:hypothetical protein